VEKFQLWATLRQVDKRADKGPTEDVDTYPCLVVKRNRIDPLTIVPLGHFLHLLRFDCTPVRQDGILPPAPVDPMTSASALLTAFNLSGASPAQCLSMALRAGLGFALKDTNATRVIQGALQIYDRWCLYPQASTKFNFWNTWDKLVLDHKPAKPSRKKDSPLPIVPPRPLMAFNRGDADATVFVAMPFDEFMELLKTRWAHVRKNQILRLMTE
jgi:hypothetical protein